MQSWLKEIEAARTGAEVLATTRDYVSLWSPAELREFPEDCRQIRVDTPADIPRLREKLAEGCARSREAERSERVHDFLNLMARASDRLGEIGASA